MSNNKSLNVLTFVPGEDFWNVVTCACRYCLGRRTYMPYTVTEWIMENCEGKMPKKTLAVMINDIEGARNEFEGTMDVEIWDQFEGWLTKQLNGEERANA